MNQHPIARLASLVAFFVLGGFGNTLAVGESFEGQHLFVGDFGGNRILKIAPDGSSEEYAKVTSPCQLFFDEDGNLFVAGGNGILKITPPPPDTVATLENGLVKPITTELSRAKALARDREGNFWVTEYYREATEENPAPKGKKEAPGSLKKISPEGKLLSVIDPSLVFGYGLAAAPDGSMFLAHLGGQRLVKYAPDGTKSSMGKHFWARNPLLLDDGSVLVMGGKEIGRFLPNGTKETFFDMTADEFKATHSIGLAVDAHGTLYSSDWNKRPGKPSEGVIYRYEPDGTRSLFTKAGVAPSWMAFWPPSPKQTLRSSTAE